MTGNSKRGITTPFNPVGQEMTERVISIDRISRTVAGGRRIRFRALIAVGNKDGQIGLGLAKGTDVQIAIAKAKNKAMKNMINVPLVNSTIAYPINFVFGTSRVILKPAPEGHSIIAGGAVRPVLELAGVKNIVSKSLGGSNAINSALATYFALKKLSQLTGVKK